MSDLTEIVARAICRERAAPACDCKEKGTPCRAPLENLLYENNPVRYQSIAILDALRDPPAHVIDAGAKAAYDAEWGHGCYDSDATSESEKEVARGLFIAPWRAALGAGDVQGG
jgi:hypothetical protein